MNYQIITDERALLNFIDWLPDLADNERFYCSLFARKKYCADKIMSNDKTQLKRFLATKENLVHKIQQLEVKVGAYQLKEIAAPQESLVLYINPNPRNLKRATFDSIIKLTELLKNDNKNFNPQAEVMSCIQRSVSRKVYLDFDMDDTDFDVSRLDGLVNEDCLHILKTRGGYHILLELAKIAEPYKKSFYKDIMALGVDQVGDQMLPVPGCMQGGFTPVFVKKNK